MPYQGCARASVCVDVGANYRGDVSVVYLACDDPRVLHRQGYVSGVAWKSYYESSAWSLHQGSCSSISTYVAAADGSSPSPPHRPKGSESGVCGVGTNLPRHVSTAVQSGSHESAHALPPLHHHPCAASSVVAIELLPRLTRAAPNSGPCACARDPMSHLGHAPIAARVPQPRPPALVPCGPHAFEPRVLYEFQRQRGPASEGYSCYGHQYCE
jgi:hypothetical protein